MKCRDCVHMHVEPGKKIYKDQRYRCTVSLPSMRKILPYSVAISYWTRLDKTMVAADEEHTCPYFEKKGNT